MMGNANITSAAQEPFRFFPCQDNDQRGAGISQEHAACVAHEYGSGIEVVGHKTQDRPQEGQGQDDADRVPVRIQFIHGKPDRQEQKSAGDHRRDPAGEPIQAVHQIRRVAAPNHHDTTKPRARNGRSPSVGSRKWVPGRFACELLGGRGAAPGMRSDTALKQNDRGDELAEDLVAGRNCFTSSSNPKRNDQHRPDDDIQLYLEMRRSDFVRREVQLARCQSRQPADENRDAPEICHRRRVQFSNPIRLIDDPVVNRDLTHDRRENKTDKESHVKNVDVRREDRVPV